MTDNQGLIPNSVGLSDSMLYNLKPSAGSGRAYRCSVQPTNKSVFPPQDTIINANSMRATQYIFIN